MPLLDGPEDSRDGGDVPTHGRDTAIYQELVAIRQRFNKWESDFKSEFPNDNFGMMAARTQSLFEVMEEELNVPI